MVQRAGKRLRATARVTRDADAWSVAVPEVARTTQAQHLGEVEHMARDLVAVMLDVDPKLVDVEVVWPDETRQGRGEA